MDAPKEGGGGRREREGEGRERRRRRRRSGEGEREGKRGDKSVVAEIAPFQVANRP